MDYGHKELDTTEQLSLSFTFPTFSGEVFVFVFLQRVEKFSASTGTALLSPHGMCPISCGKQIQPS